MEPSAGVRNRNELHENGPGAFGCCGQRSFKDLGWTAGSLMRLLRHQRDSLHLAEQEEPSGRAREHEAFALPPGFLSNTLAVFQTNLGVCFAN